MEPTNFGGFDPLVLAPAQPPLGLFFMIPVLINPEIPPRGFQLLQCCLNHGRQFISYQTPLSILLANFSALSRNLKPLKCSGFRPAGRFRSPPNGVVEHRKACAYSHNPVVWPVRNLSACCLVAAWTIHCYARSPSGS